DVLEACVDMELELPDEIRVPCEFTLQTDLEEAAHRLVAPFSPDSLAEIETLVALAWRLDLAVELERIAEVESRHLQSEMRRLLEDRDPRHFESAANLLAGARHPGVGVGRPGARGVFLSLLAADVCPPLGAHGPRTG